MFAQSGDGKAGVNILNKSFLSILVHYCESRFFFPVSLPLLKTRQKIAIDFRKKEAHPLPPAPMRTLQQHLH